MDEPTASEPPENTPTSEDLRYWLALLRAPRVGGSTFRALIRRFGSPRKVFQAQHPDQRGFKLAPETLAYLHHPDWARVEDDLRWLGGAENRVITLLDPLYPPLLRETADAPPVLFVNGDATRLRDPQVAVVGSRNPTPGGAEAAYALARALAEAGFTVTSGLAIGIDAASHRGALAGAGPTVAVTGTGLDRVYPQAHRRLAQQIAQHGALVSEFPTGTPPTARNFPQRNRIISGLSLGTLVVEATLRSGSLITARLAVEEGREVFAVPGSIHSPLSRGCHALIRQGAKLVEGIDDILEELGPVCTSPGLRPGAAPGASIAETADLEAGAREVLSHLGYEPTAAETLVRRSGLTPQSVSSILLSLELRGLVTSVPGGLYAKAHRT